MGRKLKLDNFAITLQNIDMWIARNIENLVKTYAKEFSALIVTGARQAGKTSLLLRLFPDAQYISLDDPLAALQAEENPGEFLRNCLVPAIIDEVQYAPSLFRHLKILIDNKKEKGMYFLTGSQQFSLMQNVSESLAGRCGVINLYTLSAQELIRFKNSIRCEQIILKGGFPALYGEEVIKHIHWYPSYIATYIERDVRNIINIGNLRDFNIFLRALALRSGQLLSLSDLSRDVGVRPNTIKSWISVLEASHLVFILYPYHRNIGKRLVKSPKIYFSDTGLLLYLMGIKTWDDVGNSMYRGAIWETYVFNQIHRIFTNRGENSPSLWFWRTQSGEEVDFVIEKGGKFTVIESKYSEMPTDRDLRGFKAFKSYYGEESVSRRILACRAEKTTQIGDELWVTPFCDEESMRLIL